MTHRLPISLSGLELFFSVSLIFIRQAHLGRAPLPEQNSKQRTWFVSRPQDSAQTETCDQGSTEGHFQVRGWCQERALNMPTQYFVSSASGLSLRAGVFNLPFLTTKASLPQRTLFSCGNHGCVCWCGCPHSTAGCPPGTRPRLSWLF